MTSRWHSLRPDVQTHWASVLPLRWGPSLEESASSDSKVILAIRRAENLRRLLYVSCNPRAAMGNFVE